MDLFKEKRIVHSQSVGNGQARKKATAPKNKEVQEFIIFKMRAQNIQVLGAML